MSVMGFPTYLKRIIEERSYSLLNSLADKSFINDLSKNGI